MRATSGQRPSRSPQQRRWIVLLPIEAYCLGCGKPRFVVIRTVDERFPIVQCGRVRRPGTRDRAEARRVIKGRRERRRAVLALRLAVNGQ